MGYQRHQLHHIATLFANRWWPASTDSNLATFGRQLLRQGLLTLPDVHRDSRCPVVIIEEGLPPSNYPCVSEFLEILRYASKSWGLLLRSCLVLLMATSNEQGSATALAPWPQHDVGWHNDFKL